MSRAGEGHAWQGVVAGGCEQAKRVPTGAPRVADALVCVEDHEREIVPGEVVADGETCLASAHDDSLDALCSD